MIRQKWCIVQLNGRGRDEYSNPSRYIEGEVYESKMRAAAELDNLLDAGTNFRNEEDGRDGHFHPDVIGGFDYYDTLFKIGDRYYEARINIKNIKNGKLFKDVTKIKDVTQDIMNSYGENPKFQFLRTSSIDSISQNQQNATENKKMQLEIINKFNPAPNTYLAWVRSVEDIKTFEEALNDEETEGYDEFVPDYTRAMAEKALTDGEITVYSSYPIEQGVFVSASYMEAASYSGNGNVYSKRVPLDAVAWIDITQGQYADTKAAAGDTIAEQKTLADRLSGDKKFS